MPHYSLHIREEALDGTIEPRLIGALTDAVAAVFGEGIRPLVGVELIGVPQNRRGSGGVVTDQDAPEVTFSMREAAFHLEAVPDAPARLIAATYDALAGVLGEESRRQTVVTVVGVPRGRSGVAGEVA
ncbi:hypothetical protein [Kitasatospora sp. NPDC058218]|uniref:hypothetical protein n=1 Tax=Kitasatospora sp. NPDC058218 TaxID=3346385 RepID=UPI0036D8BB4C